jgi:hypothetical protein
MVPLSPWPLLSTMVRDPGASFICQTAMGWSIAARAGAAATTKAAATATQAADNLRRILMLLE